MRSLQLFMQGTTAEYCIDGSPGLTCISAEFLRDKAIVHFSAR